MAGFVSFTSAIAYRATGQVRGWETTAFMAIFILGGFVAGVWSTGMYRAHSTFDDMHDLFLFVRLCIQLDSENGLVKIGNLGAELL
jgi:hypothetical protein